MKYVSAVVLSLAISAGAFAQGRGGGFRGGWHGGGGGGGFHSGGSGAFTPPLSVFGTIPFRTYGSLGGFGNVVFPGLGNQPPIVSPFDFPYTFATRLGVTIGGGSLPLPFDLNQVQNFNQAFGGFGFGGAYPVPYPVPVGDYGYPPPEQPANVIVMPPQAQPSSPVTINQNFGPGTAPATTAIAPRDPPSSGVTYYQAPSATPAAPATDDEPIYLIALKDTTVYPAIGYWVQGDALHYITPQGKHNQVSLELVDRKTSERLNEGRQIDFHLPPG
jgi:hypothetical protein